MNIGFVSTWFERGAAYVTKSYLESLKDKNNVFVYARGGNYAIGDSNWDHQNVTWGYRLQNDEIAFKHFDNWIRENKLEIIFFNEQRSIDILYYIKEKYPDIKLGSYIDYYKEDTVKDFNLYDFLICNTKRHYSVFKNHPQVFYVPWGTNISLFKPTHEKKENRKITFFHSAGMSNRKGTDTLLEVFTNNEIHKKSKLIIHSQQDFEKEYGFSKEELKNYNIDIIEKTVTAPGLYYLGDVYVYPTTLDGLGLTLYEALSSGLPVITTNNAPMNEVINSKNGYLVEVEKYYSRSDGYYWPLSIVNKQSLLESLEYYINNSENIQKYSEFARKDAVVNWNWNDRKIKINEIFETVKLIDNEINTEYIRTIRKQSYRNLYVSIINLLPASIQNFIAKTSIKFKK